MGNTVVILDAGIGAMTLAFESAGFQVIAAYEEDKKAVEIYQKNFMSEISLCGSMDLSPSELPDMDILADRIIDSAFYESKQAENRFDNFKKIIQYKNPIMFFFLTNSKLLTKDYFRKFMDDMVQNHYKVSYQTYDVNQITGIPVHETCCCVVGITDNISKDFKLISGMSEYTLPLEEFCNTNTISDPWYYQINRSQIHSTEGKNSFLCWSHNGYVEKDLITWNPYKIPLVQINGSIRKLTHEEIACLKGYPSSFILQKNNKEWLYKRLIYSPNVLLLNRITASLMYMIDQYSLKDSQIINAINFENIFEKYLIKKCGKKYTTNSAQDAPTDFVYEYHDTKIFITLKFYNYNTDIDAKVLRSCRALKKKFCKNEESIVLAVANIVNENVKENCEKNLGIHVWDVKNILWLFEEYTDIRNNFVAMLNYSVNDIVPQKPKLFVNSNTDFENSVSQSVFSYNQNPESEFKGNSQNNIGKELQKKLMQLAPGKRNSEEYETLCTEILKYTMADYLTLWTAQEKSNADLYRFDLCCKIKNGTNQDFFDTIMTYFATKYIVFEFKNYTDNITQKEIYTTEKYLYEKSLRRVAVLISRKGPDEHAIMALKGCLRESGKLILCLSDTDLLKLIDIKTKNERSTAEYFEDLLDNLLIHLEK